ncbi:glycosyltransferase [Stieleria sp. TO1_6]|uniref:glycosyltransferase n=1 Tax=Stieleria tagensis TaxID=2956795 RepID=UPI00209AC7AC|nr:glycosyltransferase [Stieleria tagensis]MCO8122675.1 glycosyltransferase [Stieleria tagensis]
MRIDFLITELNVGGAEKALTELAIGLSQQDHRVRVLSIGAAPIEPQQRLVDRLRTHQIPIHFGGFDHWSRIFSARRWLATTIAQDPPQICQSFLFHANCLAALVAKPSGAAALVGGLRVAQADRLRCRIEQHAVARMDKLVCVSRQVQQFAQQQLSVDAGHSLVIPNGVQVSRYRDALPMDWTELGWPADSPVALFVGRLHPQKGIELIQQQWQTLFQPHPDRRLVLIGDGPLRESLQNWATGIGGDRIRILPWQSDVAPYYKAAKLLILPSRYEGMPNVVLEAMAAGRPVVCSLVHGSEELLGGDPQRRAKQGFASGEGPAMSRLVDAFFHDADLCQSVGMANQRYVESNFGNQRMIERYQSLYRSLADQDSIGMKSISGHDPLRRIDGQAEK